MEVWRPMDMNEFSATWWWCRDSGSSSQPSSIGSREWERLARGEQTASVEEAVSSSSSSIDGTRWKVPVVVRKREGWRVLVGVVGVLVMCLKHSCPHGSEYPKHFPPSSQPVLVSLTKDITRAGTSIIEGLRSRTSTPLERDLSCFALCDFRRDPLICSDGRFGVPFSERRGETSVAPELDNFDFDDPSSWLPCELGRLMP